jgi:ferredoxin
MCEFCVKHGEGKKWYLNTKNYSNDLLGDIKRRRLVKDVFYWIDNAYRTKFPLFKILPLKVPILGNLCRGIIKRYFKFKHWGQVVPIEDVEKILDFTNSITRIPCVCRKTTTGKEVRVCFLLSLNPSKMGMAEIVDQSFFGGPNIAQFERVDKKQSLEMMKKLELDGMIHTIWTFDTPFIGGLCNCDISTGCISMKMYKEVTPLITRAEFVASIISDQCKGCKKCIKVCQFEAIRYNDSIKKVEIDASKCYGCGICRNACKMDAIKLKDTNLVSSMAPHDKTLASKDINE